MDGQAGTCNLSLIDVYVENINFIRNEKYNSNDKDLNFSLHPIVQVSKDEKKCKSIFDAEITDNKDESLNIKIRIIGVFGLLNFSSLNKDVRESLVIKNTLAILFPYLRSFITTLTAQSGIKPIILPPINISALIDSDRYSKKMGDKKDKA
ncbi:protein-export chaperone SecB [Clostridium guangxiense]|uniref:protein-export chaperone SecB n=1 Tax=Clostridium guangxiense TaxID=1662055 RepID=UPI001E62F579|nr:protein-export chaperone SecB [Clostridium guangxiense]MCD2348489.1 protein-export chaperone SecB [Clostridium guangxiense]